MPEIKQHWTIIFNERPIITVAFLKVMLQFIIFNELFLELNCFIKKLL